MNTNELEKIVMNTLDQLKTELKETQTNQSTRIKVLEDLLKSYESELIDLSNLYSRLVPLTKELEDFLQKINK